MISATTAGERQARVRRLQDTRLLLRLLMHENLQLTCRTTHANYGLPDRGVFRSCSVSNTVLLCPSCLCMSGVLMIRSWRAGLVIPEFPLFRGLRGNLSTLSTWFQRSILGFGNPWRGFGKRKMVFRSLNGDAQRLNGDAQISIAYTQAPGCMYLKLDLPIFKSLIAHSTTLGCGLTSSEPQIVS